MNRTCRAYRPEGVKFRGKAPPIADCASPIVSRAANLLLLQFNWQCAIGDMVSGFLANLMTLVL
jgi:hypothetical protein